jgi:hypothetical protein
MPLFGALVRALRPSKLPQRMKTEDDRPPQTLHSLLPAATPAATDLCRTSRPAQIVQDLQ